MRHIHTARRDADFQGISADGRSIRQQRESQQALPYRRPQQGLVTTSRNDVPGHKPTGSIKLLLSY